MTLTEAQRILDNEIKYKNAHFRVNYQYNNDEIWIHIAMPVRDACSGYSYDQATLMPIKSTEMIYDSYFEQMTKEDLIRKAYEMCRRLELHELDEHFKVNNICYKDPHPERKRA